MLMCMDAGLGQVTVLSGFQQVFASCSRTADG